MVSNPDLLSDLNPRPLKVGFGKGRGFREALELIKAEKTKEYFSFEKGTIPVYLDKKNSLQLVSVRSKDLPWLLAGEHIDIAIGSSVWFEEYAFPRLKLFTKLPLKKCRLSVIASGDIAIEEITSICSRFTQISKRYASEKGLNTRIIAMEGCHEVALSLGISDVIIDIIETGQTIERMKFTELDCIHTVTHGIWTRENDPVSNAKLNLCLSLSVI